MDASAVDSGGTERPVWLSGTDLPVWLYFVSQTVPMSPRAAAGRTNSNTRGFPPAGRALLPDGQLAVDDAALKWVDLEAWHADPGH
ncbi:hypothetical protein GCM10009637_12060 [Brevibacterium luteolum]